MAIGIILGECFSHIWIYWCQNGWGKYVQILSLMIPNNAVGRQQLVRDIHYISLIFTPADCLGDISNKENNKASHDCLFVTSNTPMTVRFPRKCPIMLKAFYLVADHAVQNQKKLLQFFRYRHPTSGYTIASITSGSFTLVRVGLPPHHGVINTTSIRSLCYVYNK